MILKKNSMLRLTLIRLRRNKLAMIGLAVLIRREIGRASCRERV